MNCKKILSGALASLLVVSAGMQAGLVTNAAVIQDAESTLALSLKPEKTTLEPGGTAKTSVKVIVDNLDDAEKITYIQPFFAADNEKIKIDNVKIVEEHPGLDNSDREEDDFFHSASMRYLFYGASDGSGDTMPNAIIQVDPTTPLVKDEKYTDNGIITFDVTFPADMAEGKYKIYMPNINVQSGAELRPGVNKGDNVDPPYGTIITDYSKSVPANCAAAEITLGSGSSGNDKPTTPVTTAPQATTGVNPTTTASNSSNKTYDGEIKIWGVPKDGNTVKPGDTVTLDLYADTNGSTLLGLEVRAMFDKSKFDFTNEENYSMKQGAGFPVKATINDDEFVYVFAASSTTGIANNPEAPFATVKLKVSDTVKAGEKIEINFEGSNGAKLPIALKSRVNGNQVYLKPDVTPVVLIVEGDAATTTMSEATTTDSKTTATTTKSDGTTTAGSSPNKTYDGVVKIWGEPKESTVKPGDTVTLDLYADTNGSTLLGFEVRAMFDKSKFDFTSEDNYSLKQGAGFPVKATINGEEFVYVFAASTADGIKNDPNAPFATLKLKVSDTVKAGEKIEINFEGANGAKLPIALKSRVNGNQVYLTPEVTPVVLIVEGKDASGATTTKSGSTTTDSKTTTTKSGGTTTAGTGTGNGNTGNEDGNINIEIGWDAKNVPKDQWYHSDNVEFFKNGIVVKVGGKDVSDKATIKFDKTPGEVYKGNPKSAYTVDFTVEYDGAKSTGSMSVMIAVRGDSDLSGGKLIGGVYKAELNDAIAIAKSMLPSGEQYESGTFKNFAGDTDENGKTELLDAINIAKSMLPANAKTGWANIIGNYNEKIKD